jgi:hypothetical protein
VTPAPATVRATNVGREGDRTGVGALRLAGARIAATGRAASPSAAVASMDPGVGTGADRTDVVSRPSLARPDRTAAAVGVAGPDPLARGVAREGAA